MIDFYDIVDLHRQEEGDLKTARARLDFEPRNLEPPSLSSTSDEKLPTDAIHIENASPSSSNPTFETTAPGGRIASRLASGWAVKSSDCIHP